MEGTLVCGVGVVLRGAAQEHGPRSVRSTCVLGLYPHVRRTGDSGCPLEERGGERRQRTSNVSVARRGRSVTPYARTRLRRAHQQWWPPQLEDTSFARSRDPCTSIATELASVKSRPGWRGRFGIAVGQAWVTRRNRHRGWVDSDECAACPVSPPRKGPRDAEEKEEDHGPRPCKEKREPGFGCPYVGMQLQKSSGGVGSRISTHAALPKEWRCE